MDQRVIDAVLEEMKVHALKFTMQDMTKRLHMSKTSLYKLVSSKDELIHSAVTFIIDDFNHQESVIDTSNLPMDDKIQQIIQLYVEIFNPIGNNSLLDLKVMYPDEWLRWSQFRHEVIISLLDYLKKGVDEGLFRPVNLDVAYQCAISSSEAVMDFDFLQSNNLTYSSAIKSMVDIFLNGIKK